MAQVARFTVQRFKGWKRKMKEESLESTRVPACASPHADRRFIGILGTEPWNRELGTVEPYLGIQTVNPCVALPPSALGMKTWLDIVRKVGLVGLGMVFSCGLADGLRGEGGEPRIAGIYSPKRSILLQVGNLNRLLRVPEALPGTPFSILCQVSDLVEVSFPDASLIRQGPNTLLEYIPGIPQAAVMGGSILVRFSKEARLRLDVPHVEGRDALVMITVTAQGSKVFSLMGKATFRDRIVKEGEMYFFNGHDMQGPFLIDLETLIRSSPLTIEFPGRRWLGECTERAIKKQAWLKNLGLVESTQTMLEGGDVQVKRTPAPAAEGTPPSTAAP